MDLASIIGLISGTILISVTIMTSSSTPIIFVSVPSVLVVMGGTAASLLVSFPMWRLKAMVGVGKQIFSEERRSPLTLINNLVRFAEIARKDGILALEGSTAELDDEFLLKGIQLAVDGTDPDLIHETLRTELEYISERHGDGRKLFEAMGKYAPAFGMIGTLIGLVAMLANLDDPSQIGGGMAVALLTTLYGAIMSNLIFLPIADKLKVKDAQEGLLKEIVIRGVMSIQSGDNPRIVAQKLMIYLPPGSRVNEDEKPGDR